VEDLWTIYVVFTPHGSHFGLGTEENVSNCSFLSSYDLTLHFHACLANVYDSIPAARGPAHCLGILCAWERPAFDVLDADASNRLPWLHPVACKHSSTTSEVASGHCVSCTCIHTAHKPSGRWIIGNLRKAPCSAIIWMSKLRVKLVELAPRSLERQNYASTFPHGVRPGVVKSGCRNGQGPKTRRAVCGAVVVSSRRGLSNLDWSSSAGQLFEREAPLESRRAIGRAHPASQKLPFEMVGIPAPGLARRFLPRLAAIRNPASSKCTPPAEAVLEAKPSRPVSVPSPIHQPHLIPSPTPGRTLDRQRLPQDRLPVRCTNQPCLPSVNRRHDILYLRLGSPGEGPPCGLDAVDRK
jgi:hypothetical protein